MERRLRRYPAGPQCKVLWRRLCRGSLRAKDAHITQRGFQQLSYHQFNGALARCQDVQRGAGSQGEPSGGSHGLQEAGELRAEKPLDHGAVHRPK
jgi:hypothetical protein